MAILHIMPDFSAGGLMREAVMENRIGNRVLPFPDDLSCGPIASDDPASRAAWWGTDLPLTSRFKLAEYDMEPRTEVARPSHPLWPRFPSNPFYAMAEIEPEVRAFWDELESTDAHIVLWFGRMAADELALYLAISERLAERDYSVVDVTALKGMERVATVQPKILTSLLGKERRPAPQERQRAADCWRRLRSEDAPFRVVIKEGLVSAPAEHFDSALLAQVRSDWREVIFVVLETMLHFDPYLQVGSLMLTARLAALAESGRVELAGHPLERKAMVRLVAASG